MNKLFIIALYNFRSNKIARWAITSDTEEEAKEIARDAMSADWRFSSAILICNTPDNTCIEL